MSTEASKPLVDFVEGKISLQELQEKIAKSEVLEKFIRSIPPIPPYSSFSDDLFDYLIQLDHRRNGSGMNAQDAICQLLEKKGISCQKADIYDQISRMKWKVEPKWLDIDDQYFMKLLDSTKKEGSKDVAKRLKQEILSIFRYTKKPPKWLQSPQWPIKNGIPLKFLEQVKNDSLHDDSYDYKFFDENTGEIEVITQSA